MIGEQIYDFRVNAPGASYSLAERNGREEAGHGERLIRAIELKLGSPYEPETRGLGSLPTAPLQVTAEYLAAIVTGEHFGGSSYHQWAENEPNPEIARLLRQNGREEVMHARRVEQVIDMMTAVPVG
jgi:hypothetical protein